MTPSSLLWLTFLLGAPLPGQTQPASAATSQDRLLVCNKADNTLSLFDPATRHEVAVVATGIAPHEVALSPDGRLAVVSDYGNQQPGHTLTVVDVLAGRAVRTIDLALPVGGEDPAEAKLLLRPHGLQFLADDQVLVTSESAHRLALVDLTTAAVQRTWSTPQGSMHMVALTSDHRRAATTSVRDGNVALFDLTTGDAPTIVPAGEGAEGLAIDPRRGDIWVGNRTANTLTVIDGTTGKAGLPIVCGDLPFRLAFTPNGTQVLVTCAESGDVQVFDAEQRRLVTTCNIHEDRSELSAMPMGICTDPEGHFAYVTCGRGEFVAVLDLRLGKLVDRIVARAGPDGIAYARIAGRSGEGAAVVR